MNTRLTRTCFAIVALLLGSFAAQAADLPSPSYKAPAYVGPSTANWTGFYVGLNGGYGFGKSDWDVPAVTMSPKGAVYGGTIGYNFQTGTWVWGLEGDFDGTGMKGSVDCPAPVTCETKLPWLATGRLRLGYAGWSNWLPYITGGAAYGNIKASNSVLGEASKSRLGWTAGAGVEYAIWSNWSVKLEYLYVNLGKFNCGIACGGVDPDNVTFKSSIVRAGINYRF
jgi:outer membrane immunogenic protein